MPLDTTFVDITYTALPSPGAAITVIYYRINGGGAQYIYISDASNYTPMGTLGSARVFVRPGLDNYLVFYMYDTAGGAASFTVAEAVVTGVLHIRTPQRDLNDVTFFHGVTRASVGQL